MCRLRLSKEILLLLDFFFHFFFLFSSFVVVVVVVVVVIVVFFWLFICFFSVKASSLSSRGSAIHVFLVSPSSLSLLLATTRTNEKKSLNSHVAPPL